MSIQLQKLISSYLRQVQELEDSLSDVHRTHFVDEATGVFLDALGLLVGASRDGQTDEDYRISIRTQVRVNLSEGTVGDLQAVFTAALGNEAVLEVTDYGNAEYVARLYGVILTPEQVIVLRRIHRKAKAAGVRGLLETTTVDVEFAFAGGSADDAGFGVGGLRSIG